MPCADAGAPCASAPHGRNWPCADGLSPPACGELGVGVGGCGDLAAREAGAAAGGALAAAGGALAAAPGGMMVFFASPLVMADGLTRREQAVELLDVEKECRLLQRALRATNRRIRLRFAVATPDAIRQALTLGSGHGACSVVHLSGHGHPSSLVLEDGFGGAHLVGAERLRDLFLAGGDHSAVRLLVVNCCHSAALADHFVQAGVRHVVASPLQIQDTAAQVFTSAFYTALGVGRTIGAAFQIARQAVRTCPRLPASEGDKFVLLPADPTGQLHEESVWPQAPQQQHGGGTQPRRAPSAPSGLGCLGMLAPANAPLLLRPASSPARSAAAAAGEPPLGGAHASASFSCAPGSFAAEGDDASSELLEFGEEATARLPVLPEDFLGRQFEMYAVCRALRTRRLVVVSASAAGAGKTTVAAAAARYLAVRSVYARGVALVRCEGLRGLPALSAALRTALLDPSEVVADAAQGACAVPEADPLGWLGRVRNRHALVVLDGLDAAAESAAHSAAADGGALRQLLEGVFGRTERVQLVLTLRQPLGRWAALLPVKAVSVPIGPLAPIDAARLFVRRTTRSITASELDRLVRPQPDPAVPGVRGNYQHGAPISASGPGGLIERLAAHRLVTRCGGNPLRLLCAAAAVTHDVADLASLVADCAPAAEPSEDAGR